MKEQKLITETQDTTWIWIIHAMIKLHNYVQFYLRVLCAIKISVPKNEKLLFWRMLAENWFEGAQKIGEKE